MTRTSDVISTVSIDQKYIVQKPYIATMDNPHPYRFVRICHTVYAVLASTVRMLVALAVATLFAPLIGPATLISLPDCIVLRLVERAAVRAVTFIARVAGVNCVAGSKCDTSGYRAPQWAWLRAPLIRSWMSSLTHGKSVVTYDQPGRWMRDDELRKLANTLRKVASESMDDVPQHRLFDSKDLKQVFSNRIVSIGFDSFGEPVGFSALVYLPYQGGFILHLGLTMIVNRARGQRLQTPLFSKCLLLMAFNHCRLSMTITNIGASPAGIGAVADYFVDTFPHYNGSTKCDSHHLMVARHVLRYYRHEFGCSKHANFNELTFVVHGSNNHEGGGAAAFIKEDGKPVSQHKNFLCNTFVSQALDFTAGDELFQVGRAELLTSTGRFFMRNVGKKMIKLGSIKPQ